MTIEEARNIIAKYKLNRAQQKFYRKIRAVSIEVSSWPPWKRGESITKTPQKQGEK